MGLWALPTRVFPEKTEASEMWKALGFRNYQSIFNWLGKAAIKTRTCFLMPT